VAEGKKEKESGDENENENVNVNVKQRGGVSNERATGLEASIR